MMQFHEHRPSHQFALVRIATAHQRLLVSAAIGLVVIAVLPSELRISTRRLVAWDLAVLIYLSATYRLMRRSDPNSIRQHARRQDEGALAILVLTVGAALASLAAIFAELGMHAGSGRPATQLVLATGTIAMSWTFVHTIFALHYANEFYSEGPGAAGGLVFPGNEEPDYWDFVYFSFVIGMTAQVSDVGITSKRIRRTATAHGAVSFIFNTTLLALSVNIVASAI